MLRKLKQATPGGKEGKRGRCVDITPPRCLGRRPGRGKGEKRGWRVDITPPCCFRRRRGGKEGKRRRCVDITPPRCFGRRLGRGKKKNVGSMWISRHPVVFVDTGGGKKGNAGGVWILHRPVVLVDAQGGEKKKKCGQRVDITLPRCLCQCLVGERRKTWAACGYHAAPVVFVDARRGERRKTGAACGLHTASLLLLPLRLLNLLAPPRSSLPTPFVPPLLLDLLLLVTPLQPVVIIHDMAYMLLLDGKVASGGRRRL